MTTKTKKKLANQLTQLINSNIEKRLKADLVRFFRKQMNLVLVAFDEYYNDTLLLQGHLNLILAPIHESHQEYYELLMNANTLMFRRGEDMAERLMPKESMKASKPVRIEHKEQPWDAHFGTLGFSEDYLQDYTFTASEVTMQRVDSEINKILTDGYREGWGVKDVRSRIMERYQEFQGYEANRIARTEMQTAHNMGMMNQYEKMGVDYIEWRAAHDKRTRRSHALLDGEIVKLGDKFSNGLRYPGDKTGSIEEWINCRCSAVPYLMSPGTMAPPGQSSFTANDVVSVREPNYGKLLEKETGGALNWQKYKQILHGKPLEQVLAGITVAEVQQQKKQKPKSKPVTKEPTDNLKIQIETICDTIEEAEIITTQLNNFKKEATGLDYEILTAIGHDSKIIKLDNGSRNALKISPELESKGRKEGLLMTVHNHPSGKLLMSEGDIKVSTTLKEKYSLTYVDDGEFLLIKNKNVDNLYYEHIYKEDIQKKYNGFLKENSNQFRKTHKKELNKLQSQYKKGKLSQEEFKNKWNGLFSEYCIKNTDKMIKKVNALLEEEGVEFIRIRG